VAAPDGDTWIELAGEALPIDAVYDWTVRADCGGVVLFSGTVRDHAEGRTGVTHLDYEAYEEQVVPRIEAIVDQARVRWPDIGRVAVLHRVGRIEVGASSVVVCVGSPHRAEAFEAARFCIDTLKAAVPIWKQEHWTGGSDWGLGAHEIREVGPERAVSGPDER